MAISSPLNPGVIAPTKRTTPERAQNFISGGAPLGSSVVASAANKIVGFQRGATAVAPQAPDLGSIIKTLSTSILSNVENRIQSINQNVNQFVTEKITNLGDSFRKKVDTLDTSAPEKLLSNFLKLYESAIGYIRFFGNPSNVKQLGKNLNSLQQVFAETFEVASKIRQTIVRIVNQLSNLPTASAGGSGLNIDVDVPGGGLRRSAPSGLMRMMRRRPGMMLGGAALAGGGAALATSALAKVGQDVSGESMQSDVGLTGPVLDRFYSILTRFDQAIQNFSTASREQQKPTAQPSGTSSTAAPAPKDDNQPTGPVVSSGSAGENIAAFTSTLEASGAQNQADVMQVMVNRAAKNHLGYGDLFGQVTAREQFSPISAAIYNDSADENAKKIYGPIAAKLGKTPQERIAKLKQLAEGPNGLENLRKIFGRGDPASAAKVLEDFKTQGVMSQTSARDIGGGLYFRGSGYTGGGVYFDRGSNRFIGGKGKGPATLAQVSGTSTAAATTTKPLTDSSNLVRGQPTSQTTTPAATQQISQPVIPIQSQPSVTVMPTQQGGGSQGNTRVVGGSGGNRETVPFLMARNDDNFLTMYSKIVYNIVDG